MREAKCALFRVAHSSFAEYERNYITKTEHNALQKVQVRYEENRLEVLSDAQMIFMRLLLIFLSSGFFNFLLKIRGNYIMKLN